MSRGHSLRAMALGLAVLVALPAAAQQKPAPASDAPVQKTPPPLPSLDFDLLDAAGKPPPPVVDPAFEAKVQKRRRMLQWHQGLGLALLGSLAATEVLGQLDFNDRFRGGGDTGKWNTPHLVLASTSTALFASVALLGVLAPTPYEKHAGSDTATLHKTLMALATAGMLAQVVLGLIAPSQNGDVAERNLAGIHQVIGYTTAGLVAAGAVVYVF